MVIADGRADELARTHAVAQTLTLELFGEDLIEFSEMTDVLNNQSAVRGVTGEDSDSAESKTENGLSKGTAALQVGYSVKHDLIVLSVEKTLLDEQLLFSDGINGKGEGQTEEAPAFSFLMNDVLFSGSSHDKILPVYFIHIKYNMIFSKCKVLVIKAGKVC